MNIQGKTIVVTGSSSGIGADTARLLRMQGAQVIGVDRNDPMKVLMQPFCNYLPRLMPYAILLAYLAHHQLIWLGVLIF
jgi:NAD(P)-dependent dehydrogenase (short-subunit alcohol dehydrogenase family)